MSVDVTYVSVQAEEGIQLGIRYQVSRASNDNTRWRKATGSARSDWGWRGTQRTGGKNDGKGAQAQGGWVDGGCMYVRTYVCSM